MKNKEHSFDQRFVEHIYIYGLSTENSFFLKKIQALLIFLDNDFSVVMPSKFVIKHCA